VPDHLTGARRSPASRALRRGWWLPVVLAIIGAAVGGYVGSHRPHEAAATVLVNPLVGNPFSPTGTGEDLVNLQSEAQLVASDRVARAVAADTGYQGDPRDLLGGLSVTVPSNTQALVVTSSASTQPRAVRRAQAFAREYLVVRTKRADAVVASQSKVIQAQLAAARAQTKQLTASRTRTTDPAQQASLDTQIQSSVDRTQQLQQSLQELTGTPVDAGGVVNSAVPVKPFGPLSPVVVFAILGLIGFLVLGLALTLLRARSGSRVRHTDDVTSHGLDVVGTISRKSAARSRAMLLDDEPTSSDGQVPGDGVLSKLRLAILMHRSRPLPISVLVATASSSVPTAVTGAGLARSLAQANLRVVLVDLGDGAPGLAAAGPPTADGSERPTLFEVLQGSAEVDDAVRKVGNGIELVPAGPDVEAVQHLLVNPRMETVMDALERRGDVVVVAAGSVHDPAVLSLVDRVDAVLVEVSEGQTRARDVAHVAQLTALGDRLAGVVYVAASDHRA
jgi:succinoglycan biosynthesis transport protein ExoP